MKTTVILLSMAVSALLMGCDDEDTQRVGIGSVRVVEVEGHDYVVLKMGYGCGTAMPDRAKTLFDSNRKLAERLDRLGAADYYKVIHPCSHRYDL